MHLVGAEGGLYLVPSEYSVKLPFYAVPSCEWVHCAGWRGLNLQGIVLSFRFIVVGETVQVDGIINRALFINI